jgi:hypothetical protein
MFRLEPFWLAQEAGEVLGIIRFISALWRKYP